MSIYQTTSTAGSSQYLHDSNREHYGPKFKHYSTSYKAEKDKSDCIAGLYCGTQKTTTQKVAHVALHTATFCVIGASFGAMAGGGGAGPGAIGGAIFGLISGVLSLRDGTESC